MCSEQRCPKCGTELVPESPAGLCSKCLLELGLDEIVAERTPRGETETGEFAEDGQLLHLTREGPGRYTQEQEHARGGMGRILIAHDEQLNREVVIKELLPEFVNGTIEAELPSPFQRSAPAVARFLREAQVTGQLQHPAIVPVHELGQREDGTLYYTMKQVQGISLSDAIRKAKGLPERLELLPHFLDLCQAVSYAHSRGVIHRDIKPGNVMVGEFGETVLLDWGLAKVRGEEDLHGRFMERSVRALEPGKSTDAAVSAFGQVLGTPVYMAPEQARGNSDRVDERSDVYALGAVLYTLLTGKPPFTGRRSDEILAKVINREPPPVLEEERKAPRELAAICHKAMAKSPEERYASAKDLAHEVQRFLSGGLVAAYEYSSFERMRRFVRRNQRAVATAAAAVFLLVMLAGSSHIRIVFERDKAMAALTQAQANLDLAQQVVEGFVTELGDEEEEEFVDSPEVDPLRRRLLMSAVGYCGQIAQKRPENDPASIQTTAMAQFLLAKAHAALGEHQEALDAYHMARETYEALAAAQPGELEFQYQLARIDLGLGTIHGRLAQVDAALAAYRQAQSTFASLVAARPDSAEYRSGLAKSHFRLAQVDLNIGRYEESLESYDRARDIFVQLIEQNPEEPDYLRKLVGLLNGQSIALLQLGETEQAFASLEESRRIAEALVKEYPEDKGYRNALAGALSFLGDALRHAGRYDEALAVFDRSRELREETLAEGTRSYASQQHLAQTLLGMGSMLQLTGKDEESLSYYEQAHDMFAELAEKYPDMPVPQLLLAQVLMERGTSYRKMDRMEDARGEYEQALDILDVLIETYQEEIREYAPQFDRQLADLLRQYGGLLDHMGKTEEALSAYEQAQDVLTWLVETRQHVTRQEPTGPEHQLADLLWQYGGLLDHMGRTEEVLAAYEKSVDMHKALFEAHPDVPFYREDLSGRYNDLAWWMRKSDPARALVFATKAVELTERKKGYILDTFAAALFFDGQIDEAIRVQKEAIAVEGVSPDDSQSGYVRTLREYEARLKEKQNNGMR